MSINETFHGYIETTQDTLLIFEACRRGILPRICRRLQEKERKIVRSGTVFVFDERESGIKRWTDGLVWSPSRILGNFLIYRELDKRTPNGKVKDPVQSAPAASMSSERQRNDDLESAAEKNKERALVGSLTNSYRFKKGGLIKKTMSIVVGGVSQHMISYYSKEDVLAGKLRTPQSVPDLAGLEISPEFLLKQNFRIPPVIENGYDHPSVGDGETSPMSPGSGSTGASMSPPMLVNGASEQGVFVPELEGLSFGTGGRQGHHMQHKSISRGGHHHNHHAEYPAAPRIKSEQLESTPVSSSAMEFYRSDSRFGALDKTPTLASSYATQSSAFHSSEPYTTYPSLHTTLPVPASHSSEPSASYPTYANLHTTLPVPVSMRYTSYGGSEFPRVTTSSAAQPRMPYHTTPPSEYLCAPTTSAPSTAHYYTSTYGYPYTTTTTTTGTLSFAPLTTTSETYYAGATNDNVYADTAAELYHSPSTSSTSSTSSNHHQPTRVPLTPPPSGGGKIGSLVANGAGGMFKNEGYSGGGGGASGFALDPNLLAENWGVRAAV